jgi:hypothetical protein
MLWLNFAQENYSAWFFGCLVVGVLLFMMFAILGGLFAGNQ